MDKKVESKICSWCLKDKATVNRHMFDGLCADCTDKALDNDYIAKSAKKNNDKLIRGLNPVSECPCESTQMLLDCKDNQQCDGVYIWE